MKRKKKTIKYSIKEGLESEYDDNVLNYKYIHSQIQINYKYIWKNVLNTYINFK